MRSPLHRRFLPALATVAVATLLAVGAAPGTGHAAGSAGSTATMNTAATTTTAATTGSAGADATVGCQVDYAIQSQWAEGFVAYVTVTNTGTVPVRWSVTITYPRGSAVTQVWNALGTQSGSTWNFIPPPWGGSLGILLPGQSAMFGLVGTGSGVPDSVTVTCVPAW